MTVPVPAIRVLLLQGPVGPFFGRLQDVMDDNGWTTARILFNGGDRTFHGKGKDVPYTGRPTDWPTWVERFLADFAPDMVVLFGDQRPIHQTAIAIIARAGIQVMSFEEGYLRPDYITLEPDSNNALSPLRRAVGTGVSLYLPPTPDPMRNNGFSSVAIMATRYFIAMTLGKLRFSYYRHHRPRGLLSEAFMWNRNAVRKWTHRVGNLQAIHHIIENLDNKYFIVALQVHDDLQLRCHGNGWTIEKLVEATIASFAKYGLPDNHLVIKGHPLDRGHSNTRENVRKLAKLFQIPDRVHYIDDGSLGLLTRHSRGMVTINSTSAITSFGSGRPVFAFGSSFFEALTANGANQTLDALSRFWRVTPVFDVEKWQKFRALMIEQSQINGSFYLAEEIDRTCGRVIQRIASFHKRSVKPVSPVAEVVSIKSRTRGV